MVTVFTSPTCHPCRISKKVLDDLNVDFVERDVTADKEAAEIVRELGHLGVPVVLLDNGDHWQGLDPDRLKALAA